MRMSAHEKVLEKSAFYILFLYIHPVSALSDIFTSSLPASSSLPNIPRSLSHVPNILSNHQIIPNNVPNLPSSFNIVVPNNIYISSLPDQYGPRLLPRQKPEYSSPLRVIQTVEKHNCSLADIKRAADICMADINTRCADESVAMINVDLQNTCHSLTKTVCTIVTESVINKKCKYHYQYRYSLLQC